jgi:hypothetical protein
VQNIVRGVFCLGGGQKMIGDKFIKNFRKAKTTQVSADPMHFRARNSI